jgi:hypothetical protein
MEAEERKRGREEDAEAVNLLSVPHGALQQ